MANLADILVTLTLDTSEFNNQLKNVAKDIKQMSGGLKVNAKEMQNNMKKATSEMSKNLNTVGKSSSYLARTVDTDMQGMYSVLKAGVNEFNHFGMTGRQVGMDVKEQFSALPKHLQRYVQRLKEAGKSTEGFAKLNEMYGARVIEAMKRSNDYLQNKTMQSTKIIQHLDDTNLSGLSQQFLKLGERMEATAKKGTALNLALSRMGENSSLKDLRDEIKFIEQGVGRARATLIGLGIATGLSVWGLVLMSNEVDGRLIPAFDELKSTWLDALTPFVKAFTTFVVWIMEGVTAVGKLMKSFAEANPQLSQMFWGILLLTMAIGTLLAPLAVGIGLTGGLAASFSALWAVISPFVLGILTVAGTALILATAIVTVVAVINNLWKRSEAFREAWLTIWENVKTAFMDGFVAPVQDAWNNLKETFSNLISTITGGAGTMGNLWTWLGDHLAVVVEFIGNTILPILQGAFSMLGQIAGGVINLIASGVQWIAEMWSIHGETIKGVLETIWIKIMEVFTVIQEFLASKMPQIQAIVGKAFNFIKTLIGFVMDYIVPAIITGFNWVMEHLSWLFPIVQGVVLETWTNIKNIISSALNIIENVIEFFTNILKGNWKEAWENVKEILKNALKLVWNFIQVTIVGKVLKIFKALPGNIWSALKTVGSKMLKPFKDGYNKVKSTLGDLVGKVKSKFGEVKTSITDKLKGLANKIGKPFKDGYNKVKGWVGDIKDKVKNMFNTHIKTPSFGFTGSLNPAKWASEGLPKLKINWNAKGNIFNGASILGGGQGVGEAGAEAVMPIQHKRYMKPYASSVAEHLDKRNDGKKQDGGNQYTIEFNEPVVIREDADIQRIVDELEKRKRIEERSQGIFS